MWRKWSSNLGDGEGEGGGPEGVREEGYICGGKRGIIEMNGDELFVAK